MGKNWTVCCNGFDRLLSLENFRFANRFGRNTGDKIMLVEVQAIDCQLYMPHRLTPTLLELSINKGLIRCTFTIVTLARNVP